MTFKSEHSQNNSLTTYIRLSKEDFERTTFSDTCGTSPPDQQTRTVMLLRPKKSELTPLNSCVTSEDGLAKGHRVIDVQKLTEAMNCVCKEHREKSPVCTDGVGDTRGRRVSERNCCAYILCVQEL